MPFANLDDKRRWQREYGAKNRAKITAATMAWKKAHPESDAIHDKRYAEKNRDKLLAKSAAYRASDAGKAVRAADGKMRYAAMSPDLRKARCVNTARFNAKKKGLEFNIAVTDLLWPAHCPVLGIKLNYGAPTNGKNSHDSPSLDRHDHTIGYVPGNVIVMSWRANRIKTDASNEEVRLLFEYLNRTRSN